MTKSFKSLNKHNLHNVNMVTKNIPDLEIVTLLGTSVL